MGQIQLGGSIGVPGSAAILGSANVTFPSNVDYTLTPTEWSNKFLSVSSAFSLGSVLNLICPLNKGQEFIVQNNTSGGQSIVVKGATGTGVVVLNGDYESVFCDGTSYLVTGTGGGGGGSFSPGGDLSGSTSLQFVGSLSGVGGGHSSVLVDANGLQFAGTRTGSITHAVGSGDGGTFTLQAQGGNTSGNFNGGGLFIGAGIKHGTGTDGSVNIQSGGVTQILVSPTTTTFNNSLFLNTKLDVSQIASGTNAQFLLTNLVGSAWATMSQDVNISNTGVASVVGLRGVPILNQSPYDASFDGYALTFNHIVGWNANPISGLITLGGDVTGSASSNTISSIQGSPVSTSGPAVWGQTLVANLFGNLVWSFISNHEIDPAAGISVSKLEAGTAGQILINSSTPGPYWRDVTGDLYIDDLAQTQVNALTYAIGPFGDSPPHASRSFPTKGDFVIASSTTDYQHVALSGDVSASTSTPGLTTVTGIKGSSITGSAGQNQILQFQGSNWVPTSPAALGSTTSVTGSSYAVDSGSSTDFCLLCNHAGAVAITLPAPANGRIITTTDASGAASSNNITINPHTSELINGTSSYVINANNGSVTLISNGTNWFAISKF